MFFLNKNTSDSHTEPQRPCPHVSSVHMSQLRSWLRATAAAATSSTDRRHRQCCSCASLAPVAHRMQQATLSRLSDLRAGEHACQMQTSTVGSHKHACACAASVVARCAGPEKQGAASLRIMPARSASSRRFQRCAERHGFLLEIACRGRQKLKIFASGGAARAAGPSILHFSQVTNLSLGPPSS